MISFDAAMALVLAEARPLGREEVALDHVGGRRLADPLRAQIDAPRSDVSTMDGYAVRDRELGGPLRVVGESWPGRKFAGMLPPRACVRIFTGAPVPDGCDRVVVQELAIRDGDRVTFAKELGAALFIRRRASDFRADDVLVEAGRCIDARVLVAAAGGDCRQLTVWRRPNVAILATGDELIEPGSARAVAGAVPDSASYGIVRISEEAGAGVAMRRRVPDDRETFERFAEEGLDGADLVVVIGGASVGEKDLAKAVFAGLGLEFILSSAAIKPGKPVWFGRARSKLVLGLPGNPTSAMVTARLFLRPLLIGLAGGDPNDALRWREAALAAALPPSDARETFLRGRWREGTVEPLGNQDSGAQSALVDADLLIRQRPHSPPRAAGEVVEVLDF